MEDLPPGGADTWIKKVGIVEKIQLCHYAKKIVSVITLLKTDHSLFSKSYLRKMIYHSIQAGSTTLLPKSHVAKLDGVLTGTCLAMKRNTCLAALLFADSHKRLKENEEEERFAQMNIQNIDRHLLEP